MVKTGRNMNNEREFVTSEGPPRLNYIGTICGIIVLFAISITSTFQGAKLYSSSEVTYFIGLNSALAVVAIGWVFGSFIGGAISSYMGQVTSANYRGMIWGLIVALAAIVIQLPLLIILALFDIATATRSGELGSMIILLGIWGLMLSAGILGGLFGEELAKRFRRISKPQTGEPNYSNIQPYWKLFLLNFFTLGLFSIYWFYRNWKDFKEDLGWILNPTWRTVGLLVPWLGIYFVYQQFRDIKKLAELEGVKTNLLPIINAICYYSLMSILSFSRPNTLDQFAFDAFLLLLIGVTLIPPQRTLNAIWSKRQPLLSARKSLTLSEAVFLVFGIVIFAVNIAQRLGIG